MTTPNYTALAEAVRGRVDELQRLCDAATPGPVTVALQDEGGDAECWTLSFDAYPGSTTAYAATDDPHGIAALHLFAAARTALPALLTYARGLLDRCSKVEADYDRCAIRYGERASTTEGFRISRARLRTELAELAALLEVGK